jgi:hypothetical protein
MSTIKISSLTELVSLTDTVELPVAYLGVTKKVTARHFQDYVLGNLTVAGYTLSTDTATNSIQLGRDIVPVTNETISLGSSTKKFKTLWVGTGSVYITDKTLGTNAELTVDNGVLQINGADQLQVGQLKFIDNTIESTTGSVDIEIGVTESTADLVLNRNTVVTAGKTLKVGNDPVVTEVVSEFNPYFRDANGTFAGTATVSASYVLHGSVCNWHVRVEFAGTTEYGDSQYQITLPFAAHTGHTTANGSLHQVGGGGGSGANTLYAIMGHLDQSVSSTVMKLYYRSSTSDAVWKWNTPGGVPNPPLGDAYWAVAGDAHFDISGTYQIA